MPRPKAKSKAKKRRLIFFWAASLALLLVVATAVSYGAYTFWHQHIEAGQFQVSDTFLGENLRDSLDLKLAAKASYPSAPIQITRDLGSDDGIDHQEFSFAVKADRLTEYGLLTLPATPQPSAGYPTLILLHGFSSPRDYDTDTFYLPDMEFYSHHGFAVFKPDLRGQGLSIHSGHVDSAYYSMAYNTDVMSLITALRQTGLVDKGNMSIWGHSMGAYIGLRAAVLSPYIKNLILLSGPVDSLTKMYTTYIPPSDSRNPYALETRNTAFAKYHTPDNDQFWRDASPIDYVSQIIARIQIHVGLEDRVVPPVFSADLNAALAKAGIKHGYYTYKDDPHSLQPDIQDVWTRSLQLLAPASSS